MHSLFKREKSGEATGVKLDNKICNIIQLQLNTLIKTA